MPRDFNELYNSKTYVDKSLFIRTILDDHAVAKVLLYPPCGKSLNLSMLRYFFAEKVNGEQTKNSLFSDLKINGFPDCMAHQGKYSVIYLDLNNVKARNYTELYAFLRKKIADIYQEYRYLLDDEKLDKYERETLEENIKIFSNSEESIADYKFCKSLSYLTKHITHYNRHLNREYKFRNPIVLIDGLDTLLDDKPCGESERLIQNLLHSLIKDNYFLQTAIITGQNKKKTQRLLVPNNCIYYSNDNARYSQYFGLTREDLSELLTKNNLTKELLTIKPDFFYIEQAYAFDSEEEAELQNKGFIFNKDERCYQKNKAPAYYPDNIWQFIEQKLATNRNINLASTNPNTIFSPSTERKHVPSIDDSGRCVSGNPRKIILNG